MYNTLDEAIRYSLARDILLNPSEIEATANARIDYFEDDTLLFLTDY